MRIRRSFLILLALLPATAACQAPLAATLSVTTGDRFGGMLVASKAGAPRVNVGVSGMSTAQAADLGKRHGLVLVRHLGALGLATYRVDGADADDLQALSNQPGVRYVERDVAGRVSDPAPDSSRAIPNDPGFDDQWDLQRMNVADAWEIREGASDAVIAVLDTGCDLAHPELSPKLVSGHNVSDPSRAPQDDLGHGTAVAGIALAATHNGEGLAGVAPNARLMPVKVNVANSGAVRAADAAAGIVWAVDHGASVLNMSLGFTEGEDGLTSSGLQALKDAVGYALERSVAVVTAAGNIGDRPVKTYPACWSVEPGFEGLIAVGALDRDDRRAGYSNYGTFVTVTAPADDVPALTIGGYGRFGGTSAAAPHVSGLLALLIHPSRPPSAKTLRKWIASSARDLGVTGVDPQYGAGCVDALAAIQTSTRKP
ncbi:MAG TPA: S8 family serine peptidase [Pantanalinema sp.]